MLYGDADLAGVGGRWDGRLGLAIGVCISSIVLYEGWSNLTGERTGSLGLPNVTLGDGESPAGIVGVGLPDGEGIPRDGNGIFGDGVGVLGTALGVLIGD